MPFDDLSSLIVRIGSHADLDALADLFDRAAPGLLRLALRVTGDPDEAEDVLQETFLAVWKGAHADRGGDPVAFLQGVSELPGVHRTFHPLAAGTYDIVVPGGYGFRTGRISGVSVGPGLESKRQRYVLDRGERVRGHVIDGAGKPAKGLPVRAKGQIAFVREDGSYELTGLDAGVTEVQVRGRYGESDVRRVDIRAGEPATADFQVTTGGAIEIALPLGARPSARMSLTAVPRAGGAAASLDLTGTELLERARRREATVLTGLAPGTYRVELVWDGRMITSETVDVVDRATTRIEVDP